MLESVSRAQELSSSKLDSLQKADPQQLAKFLQGEHPQTIALILAHLDPKQASALLMKLTEETRAAAVKRLAELRHFSPEMAQKVSVVLHRRLQALGEQNRRAYAGFKGVADLLNQMEPASGKVILELIERDDANLAMSIRNLMFTFDDLLGVPETGIRELLAQLDKKILAQALKGASNQLRDHLFKSMSSRAVDMLKEDMETLGPVRSRDVTKAQQECVAVARKLESQGKIQLKQENEDELVV
jgi:flagellar motor switch protein FliG